eukprot:jgi/Astpho2/265/Aster-x0911
MQAWSSIKEQAQHALEEAYALVSEAEAAEEQAAQLQGQADAATKDAADAEQQASQLATSAASALQSARSSAALLTGRQGEVEPTDLEELAASRLDAWLNEHPGADSFQASGSLTSRGLLQTDQTAVVEKQTFELPSLGEAWLIAQIAAVRVENRQYAVVAIAASDGLALGELQKAALHWGCTRQNGRYWEPPPPGWHTIPAESKDAGRAWQTPLGSYTPASAAHPASGLTCQAVVLQVPLEGVLYNGSLAFVVKRPSGKQPEWVTGPQGKDLTLGLEKASGSGEKVGSAHSVMVATRMRGREAEIALLPAQQFAIRLSAASAQLVSGMPVRLQRH